jgi:prevent-host-death family protein
MGEVASRELRNDTRGVLRRVADGEDVVITVGGRAVAVLSPLHHRPRWVSRAQFVQRVPGRQADPGFAAELAELAPDTTDDLPL